jgi:flagellar hook-associated protein 2
MKERSMGTPITFSGFNDIDFNLVLNSIMQQASQPLNALQRRQNALQAQIDTFDTFAGHAAALRSAADGLGSLSEVSLLSGTSSDESALSVTVASNASPGQIEVVVNELAAAQVTASATTAPDANTTIVASGGTLTIGGVAVAVTGDVTLQQLAATINDTEGINVAATVIGSSQSGYRLVLTSTSTGLAQAFTIVNALTGGSTVTFTDTDGNGVSGDSAADNAVNATDASLLINNIPVTGSSNVFEEVITGVSITARREDPDTPVQVTVATDVSGLKTKVENFIDAYNTLAGFVAQQRAAAGSQDSSIGREPVLRQLHNSLRTELISGQGSGVFSRLSEIGIEFTRSGELELDEALFEEAVATHGDDVKALLGGTDGVFPGIEELISGYSDADGLIRAGKERIERQIDGIADQIFDMQARLAQQRETLQRQFIEADLAMSRLRSQSSALSSFGGGLGAF